MSNRSGKLLSTLLVASFAGSVLAITADGPARADDTCLSGPKATTPRGSHWYYRVEPGTKRHCWYLGEQSSKPAQRAAAKPPLPAPAPDKPAQTSAATPLQPSVANARAELDGAAGRPETGRSDQATADPSPSDMAPSDDAVQTAGASQSAVTTRWPDPAVYTTSAINTPQSSAPLATVTPDPQVTGDRPASAATVEPSSQLLGKRSEPGPAVPVISAPEPGASSYSMPMLLGGLAGALAFAGLLGFAVVKFGNLNRFRQIRHRPESIWDAVDAGPPPPWQRRDLDVAPTPGTDPLRRRREIEAQSRDILELLSRASRGATT